MCVCVRALMRVIVCVNMYVCARVHAYVCEYEYAHMRVCVCMCVRVHVCVCVCVGKQDGLGV